MAKSKNNPRWLSVAQSELGVTEIPGPKHNAKIISWLSKLRAWWSNDETPWCGVFVAHCMQEAGLPYPKLYMQAKAWSSYGSLLQRDRLSQGAILVFSRKGGGHVGFYVGEDSGYYYVLGGNQGNTVSVAKISKLRCVASRWPKGEPVMGKPIWLASKGGPVSTNEA